MQTLTSTPASMDPVSTTWPVSIPQKYDHRATWLIVGGAALTIWLVAAISLWLANPDPATRTGNVISANAAEQRLTAAAPVVRSVNAVEQPVLSAPAAVQSTNAAEGAVVVAVAPIQSTNAAEGAVSVGSGAIQSTTAAELIPPLVEPTVQSANAAEQGL